MMFPPTLASQQAAISKMWTIFKIDEDAAISMRAIWPKGVPGGKPVKNLTFNAVAYPSVSDRQRAFEATALHLNSVGYNLYIVMNPINTAFAGDEHNGLAVKDADIKCRRLLLVDFDRAVTSQSATDYEVDETFKVAHELEKDAFYSKDLDPITVFSGNGAHI